MSYDNYDLASMRYRLDTSFEVPGQTTWSFQRFNPEGIIDDQGSTSRNVIVSRYKKHMWDIPTSGFKKLQAEGKILNKPMLQEEVREDYPLFPFQETTSWQTGTTLRGSGLALATCPYPTLTVPERLIDSAVTKAFAEVSANKSNALLWAGEFKETIQMFYNIGRRLYKLYKSTEAQRKAYYKGKLSLKEQQSMTLGLLYGLMPLSEAFAQWREGLFNILPKGRQTFRGFNSHSDSKNTSYEETYGYWHTTKISVKETLEANIRAGVLADIDPPEFTISVILEPRAVVSTAWALSRLSFVVDWFIGTGNWLASWSPTVGTKILASWVVIETKHTVEAHHEKFAVVDPGEKSQTVTGNGTGKVTIVKKQRVPVNPSERPYLPAINVDLNMDKIFALILLFGKTSK